jgi:hypothetical protein
LAAAAADICQAQGTPTATATATATVAAPYRAPFLPTEDSEVLQQVPAASDPKVRELMLLRAKLDTDPTNLGTAASLARA